MSEVNWNYEYVPPTGSISPSLIAIAQHERQQSHTPAASTCHLLEPWGVLNLGHYLRRLFVLCTV